LEGHTLRGLLPVSFTASCSPTVSFTTVNDELIAGDFHTATVLKDNFVDIVDFSILASRWNTAIDPTLSTGADATGDGVQGVADFTAIQINFFREGDDTDGCPPPLGWPQSTDVDPEVAPLEEALDEDLLPHATPVRGRTSLRVNQWPAAGGSLRRADLNGDGVIDTADIRQFAQRNGLALRPEFEAKLRSIEMAEELQAAPE
jgi:hypothetical protein